MTARIIHGDCLDVMREMEPASVDAVGIEKEPAYAAIARQRFGPLDQFAEAGP